MKNTVFFHKNGIQSLTAHTSHDIVKPFSEVQHSFKAAQTRKYSYAPHNDVSVNDGSIYDGGPIIL
jgi:hypothetical protein